MNKIIIDLDGTLTIDDKQLPYELKQPNLQVVEKLIAFRRAGFHIVIHTARNMNSFQGDVDKIICHTLPIIIDWLHKYSIPYDEIIVGKPWCGPDGFYVDDRAIRPNEFIKLNAQQITSLLLGGS